MSTQNVTDSILGIGAFFDAASEANFGVVIIGGVLGGLLQPIVAKLNPNAQDPENKTFFLSPLLGVAAAGISIYVLANSNTEDPLRLLFFALLCGLAFPAVLTSAVDNVGRKTTSVQREVTEIAERAKADGIQQTAEAAQQLRTTLVRNPPDSLMPEGQKLIETAAQQAVSNIAQTPAADAKTQRQVVDELQEVGTVARTAGWDGTAQAAADELKRLSGVIDDKAVKAAAEQAAQRLEGGG